MKSYWLAATCWTLTMLSCTAQKAAPNARLAGSWLLELEEADIGVARTVMHFETGNGTFDAFTRRKADKDILGGWTALLGRTFTNGFKGGSLLRLEKGIFRDKGDTTRLAAILTSALGSYNVEGFVFKNELFARIRRGKTYQGTLKGHRQAVSLPLENYAALFEQAVALTEDKIYNRAALQTPAWQQFVAQMRDVSPKVQDDLELVFAFYHYAGKLPFSHYALLKMPPQPPQDQDQRPQRVFLEEKSPQTAYLQIASFDGTAAEMDSLFRAVRQKRYQHLIVDLRNNPGGSVEAGMAFATHLADSTFYGGIFLTQKYFNRKNTVPTVADYSTFPHFTAANFDLILEGIHNTEGLCLKVVPREDAFRGKVYLLTNARTASTCEPIVYGLKQRQRAVVLGEKTAGVMLNGEMFALSKGFKLFIPTADYYTADGYRIDQQGVEPDIRVKEADALNYVLRNLIR